jgi:nucleotidyltransferase substrate binding protein (TIGR01987 family)
MSTDIRWLQRLDSYNRALATLADAVSLSRQRALSKLEEQGLIQSFEFTHELAWNLMKDWLAWQGKPDIGGSRDASREAFASGLIFDGEVWMEMIKSRNQSSHTYNEAVAKQIATLICEQYLPAFLRFRDDMAKRAAGL